MQPQAQKSLLLDKNYVALSIVTWRKAIKLIVNGKAEAVCDENQNIGGGNFKMPKGAFRIPSVLRLLTTVPWKAHNGRVKFSRKNVILRDNNECQYCHKKIGKNATIDHVMPISRGGKTDYSNCVAACHECNNKKADRTPLEAGLKLSRKPRMPSFITMNKSVVADPPAEWKIYIMGLGVIDESDV